MQTLHYEETRGLEEKIFSETVNEQERIEALITLKASYEDAVHHGMHAHRWLFESYSRLIKHYHFNADTMSMEIAEGIMQIAPMDSEHLRYLWEGGGATFYARDFAVENFLSQKGIFHDESYLDICIVLLKLIELRKDKYAAQLLEITLDHAIKEPENKNISTILNRGLQAITTSEHGFGLEWMRQHEEDIMRSPVGSNFAMNIHIKHAHFLHNQGILQLSRIAALNASNDVAPDAYLKRKSVWSIDLYEHTMGADFKRLHHPARLAHLVYLIHADGDLKLDEMNVPYQACDFIKAEDFNAEYLPGREKAVLLQVMRNMQTSSELVLLTDKFRDILTATEVKDAYAHHLKSTKEGALSLLILCESADAKGFEIGPVLCSDKDLEKFSEYLSNAAISIAHRCLASNAFINLYPRDKVVDIFNQYILTFNIGALSEMRKHTPDWLYAKSPAMKRACLSNDMNL